MSIDDCNVDELSHESFVTGVGIYKLSLLNTTAASLTIYLLFIGEETFDNVIVD